MESRILFCDYDSDFEHAELLTRLGFLVDQIRPDGLRSVSVGEHSVYVFSFSSDENAKQVMKTCDKLKNAELLTPIVLVSKNPPSPELAKHQKSDRAADVYLTELTSESHLLDVLDKFVGVPFPFRIKAGAVSLPADTSDAGLKARLFELETQLAETQESAVSANKALEAQRNFYKPKLKALLEGQKAKLQTETEKLRVRLSEIEARLIEREARLKELEEHSKKQKDKIETLVQSHQKAQESLRSFYQEKLRQTDPPKEDE